MIPEKEWEEKEWRTDVYPMSSNMRSSSPTSSYLWVNSNLVHIALLKSLREYTATAKIFLVQKVFNDFLTGTQIDRPFSCFDVAHCIGCYRQAITALGFLIQICFPFNILTLCMLKLFSTFATDAVNWVSRVKSVQYVKFYPYDIDIDISQNFLNNVDIIQNCGTPSW